MKLLIVDDNAETRRLIRAVVGVCSDDIIEGHNGTEAVDFYREHRPDWVLMDIEMRGMDGIAATRTIRQHYPEARIIIVTMHSDPRFRTAAREAGATGYILKDDLAALPSMLLEK